MLWIAVIPALALAVYAHLRLPGYSEARWTLWLTRVFLILLGIGFGWATSVRYFPTVEGNQQLALFLVGFGIAHFPAACVLCLKHLKRRTT